MVLVVKNPPANTGDIKDVGLIPGLGRPLEEGMATHSSIIAWEIQWTEKPGGIQSKGLSRVFSNTTVQRHWCSAFFMVQLSATAVAAAAKSLQSCPTLCDPIDSSPPGFPIPGILQARTLEWVAISFSNA